MDSRVVKSLEQCSERHENMETSSGRIWRVGEEEKGEEKVSWRGKEDGKISKRKNLTNSFNEL